jgi:hypothetical protein
MKRIALFVILPLLLTGCAKEVTKVEGVTQASIYFVADTPRGFKLFSEKRAIPNSNDFALSVISDLVAGKLTPKDSNYTNLWSDKNIVNSITITDSEATIDLGTISLNVGSDGEQRAIDQIVWTYLDLNSQVESVSFTVNGKKVESFAGHVDTTNPFTRAPSYDVLNPLQISSISEGDVLANPISVTGEACTFEANVVWKLSLNGKVIHEGHTTAKSACPDRSTWNVSLPELNPGSYKFEVLEYSAEDGSLFAIDDKNFEVK